MKEKGFETILFLENIRSTHNVGALFRTADTLGIKKIILAGVTPDPIDRFGRARSDIAKTALGAEKTISWEHADNVLETLKELKQTHALVALEQDPRSIDYKTFSPTQPSVFILGNEVDGISKAVLELCDAVLEIPLLGQKESLNVSVAAAVALFRILDR